MVSFFKKKKGKSDLDNLEKNLCLLVCYLLYTTEQLVYIIGVNALRNDSPGKTLANSCQCRISQLTIIIII